MAIQFSQVPSTRRTPGSVIEVDNSRANRGPAAKPFKALLLGGRLSTGSLAQKVRQAVSSADQVRGFAGPGSQLHGMAQAWFAQSAQPVDVSIVALDDDGASVAATLTLVVSASSAQAGAVPLLVAGRKCYAPVVAGDTANTIASSIRTAVNAVDGLPVTAGGTNANVVLTARNKGTEGNSIDVRIAYWDGEALPSGVTVNGTGKLAGGTTNPALDSATLLAIGDVQFDVIACAFTDTANLAFMATELASRFGPQRPLQGQMFIARTDTQANLSSFGNAQNSQSICCVGSRSAPTPPWELTGCVAAAAGSSAERDPGAPIQNVALAWALPPRPVDEWTTMERELLLHDGIGTTYTAPGGVVTIERLVTFYQLSPSGAPDASYLDVETLFSISYVRWDWAAVLRQAFPAHKLADDGTNFGPGQKIVTPGILKAEFAGRYRVWESLGIVEDFAGAMRDSLFERNASDPSRADMELAVTFTGKGRLFASLLQFRL